MACHVVFVVYFLEADDTDFADFSINLFLCGSVSLCSNQLSCRGVACHVSLWIFDFHPLISQMTQIYF